MELHLAVAWRSFINPGSFNLRVFIRPSKLLLLFMNMKAEHSYSLSCRGNLAIMQTITIVTPKGTDK